MFPAPMFRRLPGAPEWLRRSCLVGDAKRGVARAAIRNEADRPIRFERFAAVRYALVEIVIGEVVLRAGSDVEPDHLANVIRAVRKA